MDVQLGLKDLSLETSTPEELLTLNNAILRRLAAAKLALLEQEDSLREKFREIVKARKLSVKLPSNRPSGEEIKRLEGYLRGLRESIPQRTIYEASQALGDWDEVRKWSQKNDISSPSLREELWKLGEAVEQRMEQLAAEQTPALDPAPQGDPVLAPPEFFEGEGHRYRFKGLGADLALELCWKSLLEHGKNVNDKITGAVQQCENPAIARALIIGREEGLPFCS